MASNSSRAQRRGQVHARGSTHRHPRPHRGRPRRASSAASGRPRARRRRPAGCAPAIVRSGRNNSPATAARLGVPQLDQALIALPALDIADGDRHHASASASSASGSAAASSSAPGRAGGPVSLHSANSRRNAHELFNSIDSAPSNLMLPVSKALAASASPSSARNAGGYSARAATSRQLGPSRTRTPRTPARSSRKRCRTSSSGSGFTTASRVIRSRRRADSDGDAAAAPAQRLLYWLHPCHAHCHVPTSAAP